MFTHTLVSLSRFAAARLALSAAAATVVVFGATGPAGAAKTTQLSAERYEESKETRELVSLVNEAAKLVETKGDLIQGGIFLMHLGTNRKTDKMHHQLADVLDAYRKRGFEILPVSELIAAPTLTSTAPPPLSTKR